MISLSVGNKPKRTRFFISTHYAKRAGKHHDIRIKIKPNYWISFACRKDIPLKENEKRMIYETTIHDDKEALLTGEITDGYGAGLLEEWDSGHCDLIKYTPGKHIAVYFHGKKIKGLYHILRTNYPGKAYLFFKAKKEE